MPEQPKQMTAPPAVVTVKSLKDALAKLPDDTLVVLSHDAEGNRFSPMIGQIELGIFEWANPGQPFMGGDIVDGPAKGKLKKAGQMRCVILWPQH